MNAISLGWYNLEDEAIRHVDQAVRAERFADFKSKVFSLAFYLPKAGMTWCVSTAVTFIVRKIDNHASDLASRALWFEGAKHKFMNHLISNAIPMGAELRPHFEKFDRVYRSLVEQCQRNVIALRELNPQSRLAASFERLCDAANSLRKSSYELLEIAEQAQLHFDSIVELQRLNRSFDTALSQYGTNENFNPEIVAAAAEAVERIRTARLTQTR